MVFLAVRLVVSAALVGFGIGVATNYRGMARRVAILIAGPAPPAAERPSWDYDRYWAILPLSLGIGEPVGIVLDRVSPVAATTIGLLPVVIYFIAMMRLGWLYTPLSKRVLGPMFWTRRAAAIPLVAFLLYGGILSVVYLTGPR